MITLQNGKPAREALERGMKKLHDAVASSMGPAGRNMFFEERDQIFLTKDGATIARWICGAGLLDRFERAGAALLRRASQKAEEDAGDGTTGATVLAYCMAMAAKKHIDAGANVISIERGMRKIFTEIEQYLKMISVDAKDRDAWEKIAYISSRDPEIAKIVADAMVQVGPDGWIRIDKGDDWKEHELELEIKKGMTWSRGFLTPSSINDTKNIRCVMKNCPIFITDDVLYDQRQASLLFPLLEQASNKFGEKNIVVVARGIRGVVLESIIATNEGANRGNQNSIRVLPIECPGQGTQFTDRFCDDLAVLVGANLISQSKGRSLDSCTLQDIGKCEIIESKKKETTVINNDPKNKEAIEHRIAEIENEHDQVEGELEKRYLQERLSSLTKGSAIITVGGRNTENIGEKTARVEDAMLAAKSAWEEGMVPGAGMALLAAQCEIPTVEVDDEDENIGAKIVMDALSAPMEKIAENCCLDPKEVSDMARKLPKGKTINMYRGNTDIVEAFDDGVVDPLKVIRMSLLNAIEAALVFITTETVGVMIPEDRLNRPIFEVLAGDAADVMKNPAFQHRRLDDPHPNEIDS